VSCADEDPKAGPPPRDDVEVVRNAAEDALQAGSARVTVTGLGNGPSIDSRVDADFVRPRASFTVHRQAGPVTTLRQEVVVDGLDMYLKGESLRGSKARPWVAATAEELVDLLGSDGLGLSEMGQHPGLPLHFLAATKTVSDTHTEELEGVRVTRYDVSTDVRAAVDAATGAWREVLFDQMTRLLYLGAGNEIEMYLWIDADGVIRKVEEIFEYDGEVCSEAGLCRGVALLHFHFEYEWDGDVSIRLPEPRSTIPLETVWERALMRAQS
jgi:hypothetical protein